MKDLGVHKRMSVRCQGKSDMFDSAAQELLIVAAPAAAAFAAAFPFASAFQRHEE